MEEGEGREEEVPLVRLSSLSLYAYSADSLCATIYFP